MEGLVVIALIIVVAVIIAGYAFQGNSKETEENALDRVISIDNGQVQIKGSTREAFDISVNNENGTYRYRVENGNIVGVKIPGSDRYYEYTE